MIRSLIVSLQCRERGLRYCLGFGSSTSPRHTPTHLVIELPKLCYTALAFFVQQTINIQRDPTDSRNVLAISEAWPGDLINAASLARAMRADIEARLQNNETIDMLSVLDRLVTLFEQFAL